MDPGSVEDCPGPRFLPAGAPGVTDTPHGEPMGHKQRKGSELSRQSFSDFSLKRDGKIADERIRG